MRLSRTKENGLPWLKSAAFSDRASPPRLALADAVWTMQFFHEPAAPTDTRMWNSSWRASMNVLRRDVYSAGKPSQRKAEGDT